MPNPEIPDDNMRAELFRCLSELLSVAALVEGCLAGLEGKRVTLEEKMIKTYTNDLLCLIGNYVERSHRIINLGSFDIDAASFKLLASLTQDMQPVFKDLKKTIDYDWNFLEQYYEHEFYGRLANEYRFRERLQEIPVCVVENSKISKD